MTSSNTPFQIVPLQNEIDFESNNEIIQELPINEQLDPNGSYMIRSSSYSDITNMAYNAFNNDFTSMWECNYKNNESYDGMTMNFPAYKQSPYSKSFPSNYQGGGMDENTFTTNVGSDEQYYEIKGEWLEISLPYQVYLQEYYLATPVFANNNNFPRKFMLVGKNEDSTNETWSLLDNQQTKDTATNGQVFRNFHVNSPDKYSTFRLIILQMPVGFDRVRISMLKLIGTPLLYTLTDEEKEMKKQKLNQDKKVKNRKRNTNNMEGMDNCRQVKGTIRESEKGPVVDTFVNLKRGVLTLTYPSIDSFNGIIEEHEMEDEDIVDTNSKEQKETNPNIIDYNQLGMITGFLAVIAGGLVIYKITRNTK